MHTFSQILSIMLLILATASAYAEPSSFIALDNGYRWDKISNRVTLGGPTINVKESTQILKRINSYQLGAKGQWMFWNSAFVRADGHYGWVFDAEYDEAEFLGKSKGHTYDVEGSIGYTFSLTECVGIAPVVGWSYDQFNLKGTDIRVPIEGHVHHLSDIKAHQHFSGPFVGFDLLFRFCCDFDLTLGYEFHYANWHGQRLIEGHEYGNPPFGWTTGYSSKRHVHRVLGNVFKIDTSYDFCACWTIGLEFKYKFFNGDHGKYKQTKVPLLEEFTFAKVDDLEWHSFAAMIYIGRIF